MSSIGEFIAPFFQRGGPDAHGYGVGYGSAGGRDFVREVERRFRVPLDWQHGDTSAANSLFQAIQTDRALLARVVDFALENIMLGYEAMGIDRAVHELRAALQEGSNYEVVQPDPERWSWRLQRRTTGATSAAASLQTAIRDEAGEHLDNAWKATFGRDPNPSMAYALAIKAVEATAIPVVTPNDSLATLGKIVGQLRATPERFDAVFERDAELAGRTPITAVQTVTALVDLLWTNQTDRHPPVTPITQEQAEFAFHQALLLVQTFRASVKRKP